MTTGSDVVVVGGGIIGMATGWFLARAGVDVSILERSWVGGGTTSAASGTVALQTKSVGTKLELARKSIGLLREFETETDLDTELHNDGSLVVARTAEEEALLEARAGELSDNGVPIELLDGDEARRRLPILSKAIVGASFCPEDCSINPLLLVRAYRRAAEARGARVSTKCDVTAIEHHGGRVGGVTTTAGPIGAEVVVNACGIAAGSLAATAGDRLPIVPRKGEVLVTEAMPPMLPGEVLSASYLASKGAPPVSLADWYSGSFESDGLQVGLAASQMERGNLLLGSTREFAGRDTRSTRRGIRALVEEAISILPEVGPLRLIRAYAGLRPATPDGLPIIERSPRLSGLIHAAGHEGAGIALSAVTGRLVAGLVTGDLGPEAIEPLSGRRFGRAGDRRVGGEVRP